MKIKIQKNNKIKYSNIGEKNIIDNKTEKQFWKKYFVEIVVGVVSAVTAGYILYILKWN